MNFVEEPGTLRRHHDESRRQLGELVHHPALADVRRFEDRVERGDDRHPQLAEQRQDVAACLPAEDPVLVLERQDVDSAHVQEVGGATVGDQVRLGDLEADTRGIRVTSSRIGWLGSSTWIVCRRSCRTRTLALPARPPPWR